jgi:vacuolar-type H+-ATPase subunit E/Vma4
MGLGEIVQNINSDTDAKIKQVLDKAQEESGKIIAKAKKEAVEYVSAAKEKAEAEAKQLVLRELSRANIEARSVVQGAIAAAIGESLALVTSQLKDYSASPAYAKLLNKLVDMAVEELGDGCTIYIQETDIQKVKNTPAGATLKAADEKFAGGVKGESKGKDMYIDYSMESVLQMINDGMAAKMQKEIVG